MFAPLVYQVQGEWLAVKPGAAKPEKEMHMKKKGKKEAKKETKKGK